MKESSEQIMEFDLGVFEGPLKVVAAEYIRIARLKTQQDVDDFAGILREGREAIGQSGDMRSLIRQKTIERFGVEFDPYTADPKHTAANLLATYLQ